MPRKSPDNASVMSAETPAVKKVSRRKNPSVPSASNQSFAPEAMPMRRTSGQKSSPLAAVILVVLVIVAVGAYFAYAYFNNKAAEEAALQEQAANETPAEPATTTAPVAPADPTANWLVFSLPTTSTKSAAAISFKYPAELQLTQNTENIILSNDNVSTTQLNINWVKSKKSLADYMAAMDKLKATGWEGKPSMSVVTSTNSVVISGYPAVFRQEKLLAADLNQYITYVKASDTVYAISLAAPQLDQNLLAFFVTFLNNFKLGQ